MQKVSKKANRRKEAFTIIAFEGPCSIYDIYKKMSKNKETHYTTTLRIVKELEKRGLIEVIEQKGPRKAKVYGLTFYGLCVAIAALPEQPLDPLIKRWKHLEGIILKNWDYLTAAVPRERLIAPLLLAADAVIRFKRDHRYAELIGEKTKPEKVFRDEFLYRMTWSAVKNNPCEKFFEACGKIEELKKYVTEWLEKVIEEGNLLLKKYRQFYNKLQQN